MSFEVAADTYDRFMGRYAEPLAAEFVALTGARQGQRAVDVGCGPGAATAQLVERLGQPSVAGCDPSEPFVAAVRARFPDVDVRRAPAEQLPFANDSFDVAVAQLVVHFMADPVRGLEEMARVTRPGGLVAACVWDHAGGGSPLDVFWRAVRTLDPQAHDESQLPGAREGHLAQLFDLAGLRDVESTKLTVRVEFLDVGDWWAPFTLGVGPAGDYVARLRPQERRELLERCSALLPAPPFEITASAWTALGIV